MDKIVSDVRRLNSWCKEVEKYGTYSDEETNRMVTLSVMELIGYTTVPVDPTNEYNDSMQWVHIGRNTAKSLCHLLSYYGSSPYDDQMRIRETLKEIDADGDEENIVNLADEIIHEYDRFEKI